MQVTMLDNEVIRVRTPDGTLFAIVVENADGSLNSVQFTIGKAGASVAAWANALAEVMTLSIQKGASLEELITVLSGITSQREARSLGSTCRSGPEGVWQALVRYKHSKFAVLSKVLGMHEEKDNSRGASVAPWARTRVR